MTAAPRYCTADHCTTRLSVADVGGVCLECQAEQARNKTRPPNGETAPTGLCARCHREPRLAQAGRTVYSYCRACRQHVARVSMARRRGVTP